MERRERELIQLSKALRTYFQATICIALTPIKFGHPIEAFEYQKQRIATLYKLGIVLEAKMVVCSNPNSA